MFKKEQKNNLKSISIEEDIYHLIMYKSLKEHKDFSTILREVLE